MNTNYNLFEIKPQDYINKHTSFPNNFLCNVLKKEEKLNLISRRVLFVARARGTTGYNYCNFFYPERIKIENTSIDRYN